MFFFFIKREDLSKWTTHEIDDKTQKFSTFSILCMILFFFWPLAVNSFLNWKDQNAVLRSLLFDNVCQLQALHQSQIHFFFKIHFFLLFPPSFLPEIESIFNLIALTSDSNLYTYIHSFDITIHLQILYSHIVFFCISFSSYSCAVKYKKE